VVRSSVAVGQVVLLSCALDIPCQNTLLHVLFAILADLPILPDWSSREYGFFVSIKVGSLSCVAAHALSSTAPPARTVVQHSHGVLHG
jgi:hypothetical protein